MNRHDWSRNKPILRTRNSCNEIAEKRSNITKPTSRTNESEEEAMIRRFHDAQRMARFRAKKKRALQQAQTLEAAKLLEMSLISELKRRNISFYIANSESSAVNLEQFQPCLPLQDPVVIIPSLVFQSKYSQLLAAIEELGKDIKLTYAGNKSSADRLKIGIVHAKMLVKECLLETETNSK